MTMPTPRHGPGQVPGWPAPPPPPPKRGGLRGLLIGAGVTFGVLVAVIVGGAVLGDDPESTGTANAASTSTSTPDFTYVEPTNVVPTEDPTASGDAITADTSCDYLLDFDSGHHLVASAFVSNEGDVGAQVKVTATWRQAGAKALTQSKTVAVPPGASGVEVQFDRKASGGVIDRIQAVPTEKQCEVSMTLA